MCKWCLRIASLKCYCSTMLVCWPGTSPFCITYFKNNTKVKISDYPSTFMLHNFCTAWTCKREKQQLWIKKSHQHPEYVLFRICLFNSLQKIFLWHHFDKQCRSCFIVVLNNLRIMFFNGNIKSKEYLYEIFIWRNLMLAWCIFI